jgi:hypothetical protein
MVPGQEWDEDEHSDVGGDDNDLCVCVCCVCARVRARDVCAWSHQSTGGEDGEDARGGGGQRSGREVPLSYIICIYVLYVYHITIYVYYIILHRSGREIPLSYIIYTYK